MGAFLEFLLESTLGFLLRSGRGLIIQMI